MFDDIQAQLVAHLYAPFSPTDRFFIGYVGCAIALALLVYWRAARARGRSFADVIGFLFPRRVLLHASALLDYRFIFVNYYVFALLLGAMLASTATSSAWMLAALKFLFGPNTHPMTAGFGTAATFTIIVFIVIDFANFFGHWLQHRVPLLWEFHKIHHSAEVLTPITALRVHPVSEIFSTQVIALFVGAVNGTFLYLYDGPVGELTVYGANALDFLYYSVGAYHLAHSHVWLMFPRVVREIFYSPALHLIHHSTDPKHRDKNFAFSFTIWDRLAGTLYMPADEEQHGLKLGLDEHEQRDFQSLAQLYLTPFRNLARRVRGRISRGNAGVEVGQR